MKISRRSLNILIERFLLQEEEEAPTLEDIPFSTSGEDNPRDGTNPEGVAFKRKGDPWGYYKIEGDNYFYVEQGNYKGKDTKWKKFNPNKNTHEKAIKNIKDSIKKSEIDFVETPKRKPKAPPENTETPSSKDAETTAPENKKIKYTPRERHLLNTGQKTKEQIANDRQKQSQSANPKTQEEILSQVLKHIENANKTDKDVKAEVEKDTEKVKPETAVIKSDKNKKKVADLIKKGKFDWLKSGQYKKQLAGLFEKIDTATKNDEYVIGYTRVISGNLGTAKETANEKAKDLGGKDYVCQAPTENGDAFIAVYKKG